MKTLGILGGVGPETTTEVYLSIINQFRKDNQKNYPSIVIYNLPFPFIIENEAIIEGKNSEKMIPYLIEGAKILEKAGADFGILPCNTLHKYMNVISESVKIPFLNIIDETAKVLEISSVKNIGILATETTVNDRLYNDPLKRIGINILYPTVDEQNILNKIITELIEGDESSTNEQKIKEICISLQNKGAENILLACTDLQLVVKKINLNIGLIDTTEILSKAAFKKLLEI